MDRRRAFLGLSAAIGGAGAARAASRLDEPAAVVQARAREDVALKTRTAIDLWGLGDKGTFDVDLLAGTITFTTGKGLIVTAPVQVIGTYSTVDGTWLDPRSRTIVGMYERYQWVSMTPSRI